jgi:hypothetical protein
MLWLRFFLLFWELKSTRAYINWPSDLFLKGQLSSLCIIVSMGSCCTAALNAASVLINPSGLSSSSNSVTSKPTTKFPS